MARENKRLRGQYSYNSSSSLNDAMNKQLMELPVDTLVDILLRLPAKSVGCIKCVSKTLLNMVNNISFSTLHTRSRIATNSAVVDDQVPRIMCCSRDDPIMTLQSLIYKDKTLTKGRYAVDITSGFLRFVFCNVFCFGSSNGDCMLINPLGERGVLRLPEISFARPDCHSWFGMGFDDETNTYKILCTIHEQVVPFKLKFMTAHILVLGTNSWRKISSIPPCDFSRLDDNPVCANGAVHWLTGGKECRRIVSFDLRREEFCLTPTPPRSQSSNMTSKLFTLRGCLATVETDSFWPLSCETRRDIEIWVLKDIDKQQWVKCYYINYLPYGFSCKFSPGEWEHGIFFMTGGFRENWVSFIDMRTGSISRLRYDEYKVVHYTHSGLGVSSSCSNGSLLVGIYSYSETLISLKDFGDLEEAPQVITRPKIISSPLQPECVVTPKGPRVRASSPVRRHKTEDI